MQFEPTAIPDVVLVTPRVFEDPRGFFFEVYHRDKYRDGGVDACFVQDNHSRSQKGTLRGLHAQWRRPQGKLVRCLQGAIFDVAVDARPDSPTFGRFVGEELSEANRRLLWIPAGFLHGFCVLSETAEVEYKCTDVYDPGYELTVLWNDPDIGIDWPVAEPILSEKDAAGERFAAVRDRLERFRSG